MTWAIVATAVALAAINFGIAVLVVIALGARSFAPLWLGVLALAVGLAAAAGAFVLWRRYLDDRR